MKSAVLFLVMETEVGELAMHQGPFPRDAPEPCPTFALCRQVYPPQGIFGDRIEGNRHQRSPFGCQSLRAMGPEIWG